MCRSVVALAKRSRGPISCPQYVLGPKYAYRSRPGLISGDSYSGALLITLNLTWKTNQIKDNYVECSTSAGHQFQYR